MLLFTFKFFFFFFQFNKRFNDIIEEENGYRELFAQIRDSPIISDNHLMLIDVYKNKDIFNYAKWSKEEEELPKVFPLKSEELKDGPCIVEKKEFERNFVVFGEDQFKYMNWNNVLAAGGSVLAALTPVPGEHGLDNKTKRKYYHDIVKKKFKFSLFFFLIIIFFFLPKKAYAGSDVNFFIFFFFSFIFSILNFQKKKHRLIFSFMGSKLKKSATKNLSKFMMQLLRQTPKFALLLDPSTLLHSFPNTLTDTSKLF